MDLRAQIFPNSAEKSKRMQSQQVRVVSGRPVLEGTGASLAVAEAGVSPGIMKSSLMK